MNQTAVTKKNAKILGILLIILGVVGLFLPVLPGWIFLAAGFAVM